MRAIPKRLLIHTAVKHGKPETDRWGNGTLDSGTEMKYVRMEPSGKVIRDKNHAEIQLAATLFYDCRNSAPKGLSFKLDEIIVFHGQKHQVKLVEPFYDGRRLHHYELGLIAYA